MIKPDKNNILSSICVYLRSYLRLSASILALAFLIVSAQFLLTQAQAAFNAQINYQGKLTDSNDQAVVDGNYNIIFKLYTVETGGVDVWTETRSVSISNGLFSVMLGEVYSLDSVDFNTTLYLGINVNSDGEMSPRKKLGAVPAAFEADKLDGQNGDYYLDANNLQNLGDALNNSTTTNFTTINSTTTNQYISNLTANNATTTNFNTTNLISENATTTNFYSTEIAGDNININNITSTNATTTVLTVTGTSTLGTVISGIWNGDIIGMQYGGTGQNTSGWDGLLTITGGTWATTTNNIANWNEAYTWGNHSIYGYITATSSETLTNKSGNISMWTNDAGYLIDDKLITLTGDVEGSGTSSIAVTLTDSGVTAGIYGSAASSSIPTITVDSKGRITLATTSVLTYADIGTVDISANTNLAVLGPITLTDDTIGINQASSTANGYLSSGDWSIFNNKENVISTSTTDTYYRGDKTWQTLDTSVVAENGYLYYTDARVNALLNASSSIAINGSCANNQILKWNDISNSWECATDLTTGGSEGLWATSSELVMHPADFNDIVVIGGSATTSDWSAGDVLEIRGGFVFDNATSSGSLNIGSQLGLNGEYFSDLVGTGLTNTSGVLTLDTSGNWAGTFDGQEGSYYLDADNLVNLDNAIGSTTITEITVTYATTTNLVSENTILNNATTTNQYITNLITNNATTTDLFITNATTTNIHVSGDLSLNGISGVLKTDVNGNVIGSSSIKDLSDVNSLMSPSANQVLAWDGSQWTATTTGSGGSGTVGSGTTGQIAYYASDGTTLTATSGITSTQIVDGTIMDADIATGANIDGGKIANWNDSLWNKAMRWDGGDTDLNATSGRASLGLGSMAVQD
ncbi:hypothetical protein KKH86_00115, partial [Patescibacteria group bacterium]|nr:hypothetical protein [Patescibacteria group bacterium]